MFKRFKNLWIALGVLIVLTPLGLLASGTAFGEWGLDELKERTGFIPRGLAKMADLWQHSPLPDYGIPGLEGSFFHSVLGYIFSAVIGVGLVVGLVMLLGRMVDE